MASVSTVSSTSRLLMVQFAGADEKAFKSALSIHDMYWKSLPTMHGAATMTNDDLYRDIAKANDHAERRELEELRRIVLEKEMETAAHAQEKSVLVAENGKLRTDLMRHQSERAAEKKAKSSDDKRHQKSRADLRRRNKSLAKEKDRLSLEVSNLRERIWQLDTESSEIRAENIESQRTLEALNERNEALSVEKVKLLAEKIKLRGDLNRQLTERKAEKTALIQASAKEAKRYSQHCVVLKQLNTDLTWKNDQLSAENTGYRKEAERLSKEHLAKVDALLLEIAELREKQRQCHPVLEHRVEALSRERDHLLAARAEYQGTLEKQSAERKEEAKAYTRMIAEEGRRNEQRFKELQERNAILYQEKETLYSEQAILRDELARQVIELGQTKELINRASARTADQDLEKRNAELAEENSMLKAAQTSLVSDLQRDFVEKSARTARLLQENATLAQKKDALQGEKDALKRRLVEEHRSLRQRCDNLEAQTRTFAQVSGELASAKQMVTWLTDQLEAKAQELREAEERWIKREE
ncbi:hypothetical protein CONPUDRAFT_154295 [Coniophora puteana RWD-64-598 SS2]|uniref:Uncharacterized protein n=1 Tax=Coniophora puteana (strain RWD-64-598) TaxID=741705 RepID=A0A5M3MMK7_CONPW|nr:uncharacterized protein CONPUDRAFT_154295 [Coniophora puteana RWD-64-598 SS2]EIW80250.1 hypothetical protein CONPUDRAFT_154295 [Coniophora puteana RWD-64-598 SS2]